MPRSVPGFEVKINAVALKGVNDDEFDRLIGGAASKAST